MTSPDPTALAHLLAEATHELRTPLTAILGLAKTLQQDGFGDDPELREELLGRIVRQGDRLLRTIEEIDQAARHGELDPETFHRIVHEVREEAPTPPAG